MQRSVPGNTLNDTRAWRHTGFSDAPTGASGRRTSRLSNLDGGGGGPVVAGVDSSLDRRFMNDVPIPARRGWRGKRSAAAAFVTIAVAAGAAWATMLPASAATSTLVVNAGSVVRPVTRVGSGTLYGLADASTPPVSIMQPLKLHQLRQPLPGTEHRPNGVPTPIGDPLAIGANAAAVGGTSTLDIVAITDGSPYYLGW